MAKVKKDESYSFVPQAGEWFWDNDEETNREIINCFRVSFSSESFGFEISTSQIGDCEETETWWIKEVDANDIEVTHGHRWEK